MRKLLLSVAFMATALTSSAQKITYIPWTDNAFLKGEVISDNGQYVAGSGSQGESFIYNTATGEIKYFLSPNIYDETAQTVSAAISTINNDGIGVGYVDDQASKFSFATGKYEVLLNEQSIARYIDNNGTVYGIAYNDAYERTPFMLADGVKTELPTATDEWIGFECMGFDVRQGNADGSILVGLAQDNYDSNPLVIWARNKDGKTYSIVPAAKKYIDETYELNGHQPNDWFEGYAISSNGKWIALMVHSKTDFEGGLQLARYHVDTDSVEYISCPEAQYGDYYYANSISDDGTIIGYLENQTSYGRKGIICKGGETEAKYMSEVYPELKELATMDGYDLNVPCQITPDGRYITGFGYVDMDESNLCYGTYVIDTQNSTDAVENIAANGESNKVTASYTTDGKAASRINANRHAVVINKMANGQNKKFMK